MAPEDGLALKQYKLLKRRSTMEHLRNIQPELLPPAGLSRGRLQYLTKEVRKVKYHAVDKGKICYSFRKRPTLIHSASYEHICLFRQIWLPVCLRNNFPVDGLMRLGFKAAVCTLLTHFEGIAFRHNRPVSTEYTFVSRITDITASIESRNQLFIIMFLIFHYCPWIKIHYDGLV